MSDNIDYISAWKDYRRRRLLWFVVWLGGVPIVFAISYPLMQLLHSDLPFYIFGGGWMVLFLIVSMRLEWFKCPRCHHWFFMTWWYHNPLSRRCVHCGLPKWSEKNINNSNAA
jgi:hypothetical protein